MFVDRALEMDPPHSKKQNLPEVVKAKYARIDAYDGIRAILLLLSLIALVYSRCTLPPEVGGSEGSDQGSRKSRLEMQQVETSYENAALVI